MRPRPTHRTTIAAALTAVVVLLVPTTASAHPRDAGPDRTSRLEAARVDRVPTPDPGWTDCSADVGPGAECGAVDLPLDYDDPHGATTQVALLRFRATDPGRRVGSLFVNPGGPGGSGVELAAGLGLEGPPELRARFDIVGFDPRGTNASAALTCFADDAARAAAVPPGLPPIPSGRQETAAVVASATAVGRACSTTGAPLSAAMSTAQVARDLDVLRRVVGDEKLTYLGMSYGTYLGNVYANMFPDRVRAVALDAVVEPHAWRGDGRSGQVPMLVRTGAHTSHQEVLDEALDRCGAAGPERCRTAGLGDPQEVYDAVTAGVRAAPVDVVDPATGDVLDPLTSADLLLALMEPLAERGAVRLAEVDQLLWSVHVRQQPPTADNADERAEAAGILAELRLREDGQDEPADDAYLAVLCTDGRHPARPDRTAAAGRADAAAPGFGALMAWAAAPCAGRVWTARDEDAWTGPFDRRTAAPVLVVGSRWDPATGFAGARSVAAELPNARLLTSDSWGHVSYGTSACVTDAVNHYLLTGQPSPRGTVCVGDGTPFTQPWAQAWEEAGAAR